MKKIKSEAGFTLIEMIAAVFVLVLLSLMVGTGISMTMHAYETVVAQSEAELLLSTAVDALADDLRYAWNVDDSKKAPDSWKDTYLFPTDFTYSSDSYNNGIRLCVKNGKIIARTDGDDAPDQQVLSFEHGAYGDNKSYKEYKVTSMDIAHDGDIFTIRLTVADGSGISASTPDGGVKIRCLNQPIPTPTTTGGSP